MWVYIKSSALLVCLLLLVACGGVSDDDEEDGGGDTGGGGLPPIIGPFPQLDDVVEVDNGFLQGARISLDLILFQGIPYADAPIEANRWRAPQPVQDWSGIRDASVAGANCIQGDLRDISFQSEDCLFLNIAAPDAETETLRPVMVWFHGGDGDNGSAIRVPTDIVQLAEASGNVVVSVNARLGFLGFLALPGLSIESANASTGNYHHLDQVAALQWLRDNIATFNGNPNNITLFGATAGGNDVCRHLSSPLSTGLFQRAILQSSSCGPEALRTLAAGYEQGELYKQIWGCDQAANSIDCLRQQSAVNLRQALSNAGKANDLLGGAWQTQEQFRSVSVIDDYAFNATPYDALANSPANIDVMLGVNLNEATLFLQNVANDNPTSLPSYQDAVKNSFPLLDDGDVSTLTLLLYPVDRYPSYSDAYADVMGDALFVCPSIATADVLASGGHSVHFYQFRRSIQDEFLLVLAQPVGVNAPDLGVPQRAELFYLWDLVEAQEGTLPGLTVRAMQQYWGRFAASGVPSADDRDDWPLYSTVGGEYLDIGVQVSADSGFKLDKCDFFNARTLR
jgi:para-nitrobenzyl esterase